MKTGIRAQIIDFIRKNKNVRPNDLKQAFQISSVAIHKHLRSLLEKKEILRHGKPPLVFYSLPSETTPVLHWDLSVIPIDENTKAFLEERYVYISPTGEVLNGLQGFEEWVHGLRLERQLLPLISEYRKIREEADRFFQNGKDRIDATEKLRNTFKTLHLDQIFYQDFYSLPKFGKTKLGAFVLFAKQSQNIGLIKQISEACSPVIRSLIEEKRIETIAFIPHSIPRQVQFLKELERNLKLPNQKIDIVKAYSGEIQVPQKSLSKLEERIINARETFFLKKNLVPAKRVLLIDDAVGSGATMNEIAGMIQETYRPEAIFGFAIVGSYKGFEVIREA